MLQVTSKQNKHKSIKEELNKEGNDMGSKLTLQSSTAEQMVVDKEIVECRKESLIRVEQWVNPTCHDVITKGSKFDMDTKTFESTGIREKQKFQLAGFDATLKPIEWATEEIFSAEQCRIED